LSPLPQRSTQSNRSTSLAWEDPSVICVQHETTSEFLETEEEVAYYRSILNRVASVALDGARSREFLAMMAGNYERQGDAQDDTGGLAEE
jgi:hypothetical protein